MENFSSYYQNLDNNIKKYFKILYPYIPIELQEYIEIIMRLSGIDYFCGMKYASNHMYNFKYNISRLDHSISCALETLRFTTISIGNEVKSLKRNLVRLAMLVTDNPSLNFTSAILISLILL